MQLHAALSTAGGWRAARMGGGVQHIAHSPGLCHPPAAQRGGCNTAARLMRFARTARDILAVPSCVYPLLRSAAGLDSLRQQCNMRSGVTHAARCCYSRHAQQVGSMLATHSIVPFFGSCAHAQAPSQHTCMPLLGMPAEGQVAIKVAGLGVGPHVLLHVCTAAPGCTAAGWAGKCPTPVWPHDAA
jgi:hypothetical protein